MNNYPIRPVNWAHHLEFTRYCGASHIHDAIEPWFLAQLEREVVNYDYTRMQQSAEQGLALSFGEYRTQNLRRHWSMHALGILLRKAIREAGFPNLSCWNPNEVVAQRYDEGDFIGRHRDYARDELLIAVVSVTGGARFEAEAPIEDYLGRCYFACQPGSIVLIRAPGFDGTNTDNRPYHSASPPSRWPRHVLTYRQVRNLPLAA